MWLATLVLSPLFHSCLPRSALAFLPTVTTHQWSVIPLSETTKNQESAADFVANVVSPVRGGVPASPPTLIKYPRTAHLVNTGAATADDIVVHDEDALTRILEQQQQLLVVEEKLDGANIGISYGDDTFWVQNRGSYIDYKATSTDHSAHQFDGLATWLQTHEVELYELLVGDNHSNRILYGEWLMARHSIPYGQLPGFFVAFDLYDTVEQRFLSRRRFHTALGRVHSIPVVPVLWHNNRGRQRQQRLSRNELLSLLDTRSAFRTDDGTVEGIVLRLDDTEEQWMQQRFKIVRSDFTAAIGEQHWSKRKLERNVVDYAYGDAYRETCFSVLHNDDGELSPSDNETSTRMPLQEKRKRQRRVPRCVMLMGLPGSGKSTFAQRLLEGSKDDDGNPTWTVVNQDTLGRKQALAVVSTASRRNRILIDRCHATEAERLRWWQALQSPPKGHVALVYFNASATECGRRVRERPNHPTIPNDARGAAIVRSVSQTLEPPTRTERETIFGTVETVGSFAQADELLRKWGVDG